MKLEKIILIISLVFLTTLIISCKSATQKRLGDGVTAVETEEGWIDKDTYRMWVIGSWDRNRYYVEGEEEEIDKEAKSIYVLRNLSKNSAKIQALRNFKERMLTYVESETQIENSTLINDQISARLSGVTIAPQAVKEEYTPKGDASVLFYFTAKGLKQNVDKAIQETIKRYREES